MTQDFHEKAARNELPRLLEKVPELRTLPEDEQVKLVIESRRFDSGSVKILIGGLIYLAVTMTIFWFLPSLSPDIEQFMSVRRGGVLVACLFMFPVIFAAVRLRTGQQVRKLKAMIAQRG
jgi:hypothetical protein